MVHLIFFLRKSVSYDEICILVICFVFICNFIIKSKKIHSKWELLINNGKNVSRSEIPFKLCETIIIIWLPLARGSIDFPDSANRNVNEHYKQLQFRIESRASVSVTLASRSPCPARSSNGTR